MNDSIASKKGSIAIVSICTCNHLHYVNVLMESCRKWCPTADRFVLVVDLAAEHQHEIPDSFQLVSLRDLGIAKWRKLAFQYTPFELSCAVKADAMLHAAKLGYEKIIFLDGDTEVLGDLEEIEQLLDHSSIMLTPHLQIPMSEDGKHPDQCEYLRIGAFNGGVLAIRNDENGFRFLQWWRDRLHSHCYIDVSGGVFVDQKWLGLVPAMFPKVSVLREPGYNVGHWSVGQFQVTRDMSMPANVASLFIGDRPLKLMHYSGMTLRNPHEYLKYQNRFSLSDSEPLELLVKAYHRKLELAGASQFEKVPYAFANLSDGTPIQPVWREAVRRNAGGLGEIEDPFDVAVNADIVQRFKSLESKASSWRVDWKRKIPKPDKWTKKAKRAIRNWLSRS